MTAPTLAAPDTATAVLEARSLTKHFAVHGQCPTSAARPGPPRPACCGGARGR